MSLDAKAVRDGEWRDLPSDEPALSRAIESWTAELFDARSVIIVQLAKAGAGLIAGGIASGVSANDSQANLAAAIFRQAGPSEISSLESKASSEILKRNLFLVGGGVLLAGSAVLAVFHAIGKKEPRVVVTLLVGAVGLRAIGRF